jgi:tetratricopeptide (TPR) repeat protein
MGTGGIFRQLSSVAGAVCVALALGCRTSREDDTLRSQLQVSTIDLRPSLALGHRFGRWLEVEPEPEARPALESACLIEQTGSVEDAIAVLSDAIDDFAGCASLFEARGALYLEMGFPRAAAGDFQRAVALASDHAHGWYALGHAYEVLGLYHQAREALEQALDLGEVEASVFLSLARAHRGLGRSGLSARSYEQALERLDWTPAEVLVEAAVLASEDSSRAARVESLRDRLESCSGVQLSDDAWLLRALVRELPGESGESVGSTFRAMEVAPEELAALTRGLLTAVQLDDSETGAEKLAELLAAEPDAQRRAALERCLARR